MGQKICTGSTSWERLLILHGKEALMCGFVLSYISGAAGVQLSTSSARALPQYRLSPRQPNTRFVLVCEWGDSHSVCSLLFRDQLFIVLPPVCFLLSLEVKVREFLHRGGGNPPFSPAERCTARRPGSRLVWLHHTSPPKNNAAVNQEHPSWFRVITALNETPSSPSVSQIRPPRLKPAFMNQLKSNVSQGVIEVADSDGSCWMLSRVVVLMNSILFSRCIIFIAPRLLRIRFPQLRSFTLIQFNARFNHLLAVTPVCVCVCVFLVKHNSAICTLTATLWPYDLLWNVLSSHGGLIADPPLL